MKFLLEHDDDGQTLEVRKIQNVKYDETCASENIGSVLMIVRGRELGQIPMLYIQIRVWVIFDYMG